jgi:hypothetical protein
MEGGVGIFLLLVILVLVVGGVIFLYVTGGAMFASRSRDDEGGGSRPVHKTPSDPAQRHTHFVGTPEGDEAARREKAAGRPD